MTHRIERQFAPKLTPAALAELDAFHATSIDRWMDQRALARVATMETPPRSAWEIVEAKFHGDTERRA